ncbi:MAG: DUF3613 domain-containing protein [Burkholderiaceae bacterium]|nr:DUF3613 domain-containing protein [Burkholderiaceae bacterium]
MRRTLIWIGFIALGSVSSLGMAQSQHQPVVAYPVNNVAQPAPATPVAPPARPIVRAVPTPAPVVAAPSASASRPVGTERVGDVTQQLLAAQAQGVRAGIEQPMLGATATAAWNRYINSFNHPIPEWFEETVETD